MDNKRLAAFEALLKIEQDGAYSNLAVGKAIRDNRPDNEAFVRNLVYGVLQQKILIDYRLDGLVKTGIRKVKPRARILLRMGLYQIDFMDSVPDYAAVSETVRLSRKIVPGLSGLINGVLRSYLREPIKRAFPDSDRDPAGYLSIKYSYSRELTEKWMHRFGFQRTESLMAAGNRPPLLSICVNTLKTSSSELSRLLTARGYTVRLPETSDLPAAQAGSVKTHALFISGSGIMNTVEFRNGLFYVQDISSMRAVAALSPGPDQQVLDVCAAPGGKSVFSSLLMENRGSIISCDIYDHKLVLIDNTVERMGIRIIRTMKKDASVCEEKFIESADIVIADVPCSGLGVIRRRPEIKWKQIEAVIHELVPLQYEILKNAAGYVRKSGKLMYSTCTISKEENEDMVKKFLLEHPEFKIVEEQQIFPDVDLSDGFYYCIMKKL